MNTFFNLFLDTKSQDSTWDHCGEDSEDLTI